MCALLYIAQLIRENDRWVHNILLLASIIAWVSVVFFGRSFLSHISPIFETYALPFSEEIASHLG